MPQYTDCKYMQSEWTSQCLISSNCLPRRTDSGGKAYNSCPLSTPVFLPLSVMGFCEQPVYAYMCWTETICLDGLPHTAAFTVSFVSLGAAKRSVILSDGNLDGRAASGM